MMNRLNTITIKSNETDDFEAELLMFQREVTKNWEAIIESVKYS